MANAAGWQPDPDDADQERYWSGSDWTDEVRPAASGRSLGGTNATGATGATRGTDAAGTHGEPDHLPQLHRALSAAVAELDAMDDRISTLFDRSDDAPVRTVPTAAATGSAVASTEPEVFPGTATDDDIIDLFGEGDTAWTEDDAPVERQGVTGADRMAIIGQYEDDIGGAFSDLDAELAAETPAESGTAKRRMFGRHAKGTTSAQR
jgi:hypothetical protein